MITRQGGLAALEFAIVLPLLLLIMLAVAELGRAFYQYNTLKKAVRDGARFLATNAIHNTTGLVDIVPRVSATKNLVVYGYVAAGTTPLLPGLTTENVTVGAVTIAGNAVATEVSVSAAYTYQPMFGGMLPTFGAGADIPVAFVLTAANTMRAL